MVSPSGDQAAVYWSRGERREDGARDEAGIWLLSLDGSFERLLARRGVSAVEPRPFGWTDSGDGIYVAVGSEIHVVDVESGGMTRLFDPGGYCSAVLPGERFVCVDDVAEVDIWVSRDFDPHADTDAEPEAQPPSSEPREVQLTDHGRVWQVSPALSPDGRYVAYSIADRPRDFSMQMARNFTQFLMLAEIGEDSLLDEPELITQMQDCFRVVWSPDARHLVVSGVIRESRGTFLVPVAGGRIRQISDRAYGVMDWAPDGSRLAVRSRLDIGFIDPAQSDSGEITGRFQLPTDHEGISSLAWSPTGDRIAVAADSSGVAVVWTVTPDGGDARRIASDLHVEDLSWAPSGDAVYYSRAPDRALVRLGPIGGTETAPVAEQLAEECRWFSVSSDGRRLTCQRVAGLDQIWLRSLDPAADSALLTPDTVETRGLPYLSPDGERIAYVEDGPEGRDLFVLSLIDGQRKRITRRGDVGSGNLVTAWSPDGQFLAFPASGPDGTMALWIVPSDGGPSVRVGEIEPYFGLTWAPSRNPIVQTEAGRGYAIVEPPGLSWAEALSGRTVLNDVTTRSLLPPDTSTSLMSARLAVSPDGATAAVAAFFRAEEGIWLFSLDGATQQLLYPRTPEFRDFMVAGWTKEGDGVYLRDGADVYLVSLDSREIRQVDVPRRGICEPEELSAVSRFLCYDVAIKADLWLIENFDPHLP
jgi:Tol biopolymer transport system component